MVAKPSKPLTTIERSRLTSAPLRVPVSARVNGAPLNLSTMTVQMAFKPEGVEPTNPDYVVGTWDVDNTLSVPVYMAQCTPPALAAGIYMIWLQLIGAPDNLQEVVGILSLY